MMYVDFMWFCQPYPSNFVIKNVGIEFAVLLTVLQSEVQVVAPAAIQFYMIENGISNIKYISNTNTLSKRKCKNH